MPIMYELYQEKRQSEQGQVVRTCQDARHEGFDVAKNIKSSHILFQPETEKDGSSGTRSRVMA